jgi:hypothetical protein
VRPRLVAPVLAVFLAVASGCAQTQAQLQAGSPQEKPPELGACRMLTPDDIVQPYNTDTPVDCSEDHTAETFAVGTFPATVAGHGDIHDPALGGYVYRTCNKKFRAFLGGDESQVLRSTLTWAWFRPSPVAWDHGARWYRCDVIGGGEQSKEFLNLPETAKGILAGPPDDRWVVCADGPTVSGSVKIPCSQPHTWRAVTTIKLGQPGDTYPGDRVVQSRTRSYCSDSVGAWLNYPVNYQFGFTWFHQAEWQAGNRRSICWARTKQ